MDPVKVHNVFEVPAHQNVDPANRCRCNVPGILQVNRAYDSGGQVLLGKLGSCSVERHFFQRLFRHRLQDFADLGWRPFELGQSEIGEHENVQSRTESAEELGGVCPEFFVQAAAHNRGVRVDSASHDSPF